jgi:hypothetical protein
VITHGTTFPTVDKQVRLRNASHEVLEQGASGAVQLCSATYAVPPSYQAVRRGGVSYRLWQWSVENKRNQDKESVLFHYLCNGESTDFKPLCSLPLMKS